MKPNLLQKFSLLLLTALFIPAAPLRAADVIEKLRGPKLKGTIVAGISHFCQE